jgi:hypothetical protein
MFAKSRELPYRGIQSTDGPWDDILNPFISQLYIKFGSKNLCQTNWDPLVYQLVDFYDKKCRQKPELEDNYRKVPNVTFEVPWDSVSCVVIVLLIQ